MLNAALNRGMSRLIAWGWVRRRKLMIVATDRDIARMEREIESAAGFLVVARVALPHVAHDATEIDSALQAAVGNARALGIEDVIISDSLSGPDFLERSVNAFSVLPVAIHLSAGGLLGRFKDARIARFGRAAALSLTRAPLSQFEATTKRWFDVRRLGNRTYSLKPAVRSRRPRSSNLTAADRSSSDNAVVATTLRNSRYGSFAR